MKTFIAGILYAIGIVVYALWILGDRQMMSELREELKDDDWYSTLPESIVNAIFVAIAIVLGTIWPYMTVRQLLEDLKK